MKPATARSDEHVNIQSYLTTVVLTKSEESYYWCLNEIMRNRFSIGEAYHLMKPHTPLVTWYRKVWFSGNIPRHIFLTWLIILNRSQTRDRLSTEALQWIQIVCYATTIPKAETTSISTVSISGAFVTQYLKGDFLINRQLGTSASGSYFFSL